MPGEDQFREAIRDEQFRRPAFDFGGAPGEPSHDEVLWQMESMGGTFVSRLAKAWRAADGQNMLKLAAAFGDIYETYRRMGATPPGRTLYARRHSR